ncbi:hypothetical protein EG329_003118 [Mollisiaceae sp. DMI_Dod_QoI]|nr:hypothetical protein EG329_003118 [Helotiales sp. DMI_Dod_QoI]
MPRTFRETIELTRLLGAQYLWIDSLCIIQDSREDWLHESSIMGEVYAHGALNIAATVAVDGDGGIFSHAPGEDQWIPLLISSRLWSNSHQNDNVRDYVIYPEFDPEFPEVWKNVVEETPLGERGWVLQERILSPRVLHFAENQCFWECCQETAAELFPKETFRHDGFLKQIIISVPPDHEIFENNQAVLYTYWDALIEKYSRCDLTFESDKLVAFAGLAQRACRQLGLDPKDYMGGLWRPKIAQGLLWHPAQYDPRRRGVTGRGPSWSWTSREGTVYTFSEDQYLWGSENCHITILDYEMLHDGHPFGQVSGGRLRLRGCLCRNMYKFLRNSDHSNFNPEDQFPHWMKDDERVYPSSYFLLVLTHRTQPPLNGRTVISGLVLVPTGLNFGQFRRIGMISTHPIDDLKTFIKNGKDPDLLDPSLYQEADAENGFTIELV